MGPLMTACWCVGMGPRGPDVAQDLLDEGAVGILRITWGSLLRCRVLEAPLRPWGRPLRCSLTARPALCNGRALAHWEHEALRGPKLLSISRLLMCRNFKRSGE